MNQPAAGRGSWSKVELFASVSALIVLATVLVTRLSFAGVWQLPWLDLLLIWLALAVVAAALLWGLRRRWLRLSAVAFGTATQLVPMVTRQPALLVPLLGAIVPLVILTLALNALSRKSPPRAREAARS